MDDLQLADIGGGTGASTLVLAAELDAHVTAAGVEAWRRYLKPGGVLAEEHEISRYESNRPCVSCGFYSARKAGEPS